MNLAEQVSNPVELMRRKVLIVDDHSINREILSGILDNDYDIMCAEDGKKALDVIEMYKDSLSAVLLDLTMPVMDGYEVLRKIQEDPITAEIPVLVATQKEGDAEELTALTLGAVDFLTKPYKPEIIKHRLAKTIRLRESSSMLKIVEKDALTGLYTRDFFFTYGERLIKDNPEKVFDLIEVDIDNFKLVNDLYGKNTGDDILKRMADLMRDSFHDNGGISSRVMADNFIAILEHRDDYQEYLPKLFRSIEEDQKIPHIKLRFGIYNIKDCSISMSVMYDRVTMAADAARDQYNTACVYYDDSMRQTLLDEQMMTGSLQEAIDTRQFIVYIQPKFDIGKGKLAGAEALVRWIHPEKGFLSPGVFIPLFERNGLIYKLDRYVWEETCRIIHGFKVKYGKCVPVSVNISRVDVYDPKLPEILNGLIDKYDLDHTELHLEITESAYARDPGQLIEIVNTLKKSGFIIEMDDFGSGYSSLNMLSNLTVDVLKLDMKFLQEGHFTKEEPGILKYIMEIAKWMRVPVVAEGIETAEQVDMLKSLDCEYAQGYFYSKPLPEADFEKILAETE